MKFITCNVFALAVIVLFCLTTAETNLVSDSKSASHKISPASSDNVGGFVEFDKKSSSKWGKAGSMWGKRSGGDENEDVDDEQESNEDAELAKRGWEKAGSMWGKRASNKWGKASSMWGKRAGGNWAKASSMWGKRQLINNLLDNSSPADTETKW